MKNILINVLLILMFVVGLLLIFINPIQNYLIGRMSEKIVEAPIVPPPPADDIPLEYVASYDFEAVQSLTIWDILEAQANAKDIPAIGSIHIPEIDMTLPILTGVGKYALAVGAGTMKKNQQMGEGNYALASHYVEGKDVLFGPLYDLEIGDTIYLSDAEYVYEYKTSVIDIIEATDVYIIDNVPDQKLLTLITCAEKGTRRLAVQAQFVNKIAQEDAEQLLEDIQ